MYRKMPALGHTIFTIFMLVFMNPMFHVHGRPGDKCSTNDDLTCYNCLHIGIQGVKESHGCEIGKMGDMDLVDKVTYYRIYKDVSEKWSADVVINRSATSEKHCALCVKEYSRGNTLVSRGKMYVQDPAKNGKCEQDGYTPELTICYCGTNGCNNGDSTESSLMVTYSMLFSMTFCINMVV